MFELRMPQWGMNMTEGTILQWLKNEGERVEEGEPLVEIETAKSINTVDAPVSGVVAKIVAQASETIATQEIIALIGE